MLSWGREMTFIENSPCASDLPTLISHLIFAQTSCRVSSSHSAPGKTEDLQWRWVPSREPIKENHTEDSRYYFHWKHINIFRSNLFWSCQDLALNLFVPVEEGLGWKQRRVYQGSPGECFQDTLDPTSLQGGSVQRKGNTILSPQIKDTVRVCLQSERCCLLLSRWLLWRFKWRNVSAPPALIWAAGTSHLLLPPSVMTSSFS